MTFSIQSIIWVVIYLVGLAMIFSLLDWWIRSAPFVKAEWKPTIRWILLTLGIFALIGLILSFMSGTPIIRMQ